MRLEARAKGDPGERAQHAVARVAAMLVARPSQPAAPKLAPGLSMGKRRAAGRPVMEVHVARLAKLPQRSPHPPAATQAPPAARTQRYARRRLRPEPAAYPCPHLPTRGTNNGLSIAGARARHTRTHVRSRRKKKGTQLQRVVLPVPEIEAPDEDNVLARWGSHDDAFTTVPPSPHTGQNTPEECPVYARLPIVSGTSDAVAISTISTRATGSAGAPKKTSQVPPSLAAFVSSTAFRVASATVLDAVVGLYYGQHDANTISKAT